MTGGHGAPPASPGRRLPVTVVTGFLGSGKTTLLRHLLLHSGRRLAVLVNEFGELGIDGELLRSCGFCPEEERGRRVVELANGCLCCTVQEEFLPTMLQLLEDAPQLDGIVVETSGLALPEPLLQAFAWPEIRTRTRVHGVVTVVDGEALAGGGVVSDPGALEAQRSADPNLDHGGAFEDLFEEQLEVADLVLVSRQDRLGEDAFECLRPRLQRHLRPGVVVLPMAQGQVDPALVLDARGLERLLEQGQTASPELHSGPDQDHDHDHDHHHPPVVAAVLRLDGAFDRSLLEQTLLAEIRRQGLIRLKGTVQLPGKSRRLVVQAVGPRLDCWFEGEAGAQGPAPGLELVAMGLSLEAVELELALQRCLATPVSPEAP